jgi:hypothetical protein
MSGPLPNTIEVIEAALLAELQSAMSEQLRVEGFPDDPDRYRLQHPVGALLIAFGRAKYSKPEMIDAVVQDVELEWYLTLLIRNLRTHTGAYAFLDATRIAITGFQAEGCTKLYCMDQKFLGQGDGVWRYGMTFCHNTTVIEADDDTVDPLLKRLIFAGPGSDSTEIDATD